MKLYNTIIVWDVYTVGADDEDPMAVLAAATEACRGDLPASTGTALHVTQPREVRAAWVAEKPLVSNGVSDADFEQLKGKTTMEIFKMLHEKPEATK